MSPSAATALCQPVRRTSTRVHTHACAQNTQTIRHTVGAREMERQADADREAGRQRGTLRRTRRKALPFPIHAHRLRLAMCACARALYVYACVYACACAFGPVVRASVSVYRPAQLEANKVGRLRPRVPQRSRLVPHLRLAQSPHNRAPQRAHHPSRRAAPRYPRATASVLRGGAGFPRVCAGGTA